MLRMPLAVFFLLSAIPLAWPQGTDRKPGDAMIEKYLAAEADRLALKYLDGAKTLDEWKEKRPRLRQEYLDMLGLWPYPEKTPLNAVVAGTHEAHGVIVENIFFESKPKLYVTANFYRPKQSGKPLPTVVYVCGHTSKGRDGNKSAFQDHGFWFANNGYTCLILDTLQLGEIAGIHHGTYGLRKGKDQPAETRMWWHSAGYTPAGVECWNGVRAIDYLLTRPEVDRDKIGVTGISGGGAATIWIAAADERVKVAVPVSGMGDLQSYIKDKGVNGHCDCMFLYNTYQWDWTTIAAMIAPRPMLFANSDNDRLFPMDANRRIIAKLRQIYTMYGQPDVVDEYVSVGGHDYRPDLRLAIFQFLNKHLKGDAKTPVEDSAKYTPIEGKLLRAFPEDKDIPKDQVNTRADEVFVPKAKVALPEAGKFAEWQKEMIAKVRTQSFHTFPAKVPASKVKDVGANISTAMILETEANITPIEVYSNISEDRKSLSMLILANSRELTGAEELFGKYMPGIPCYLRPRGSLLEADWTSKSPPNFVARAHLLLGRTVDQGPIWDALANHSIEKVKFRILGKGHAGIFAAYAALLEPSIHEIIVIHPPKSHMEGPHFPGILRVIDIPDALGLLAPRPLTIIGGLDPAFDRTAEIYRLAGAADKLTRK